MNRVSGVRSARAYAGLRLLGAVLAGLVLPPLIAITIVPVALILASIAWLAIPFVVTKMLANALAARGRELRRTARKPVRGVVPAPA